MHRDLYGVSELLAGDELVEREVVRGVVGAVEDRRADMDQQVLQVGFFFQAEDGIRDGRVTGVQTCALPISKRASISSRASRLFRKMSRHITGSLAAMRVKSRKPEAANCSTSWRVSPSRSSAVPQMVKAIRCGRCDTTASTRSWWPGSIRCTIDPQRRQNSSIFATADSSVPGGGVSSAQRPWKSVVKPESGPEYSVPATGWAGTKCTPAGTSGPMSRITDCLVDPTSVRTAPGSKCGAIAIAMSANAPTGAHSITPSAPCTAQPASVSIRSAKPSSRTRASVWAVRAVTTTSPARSPRSLAMRATELPISPMPISASRRNTGSGIHKLGQGGNDDLHLFGGADSDTQAMGQPIATNRTRDRPPRAHVFVRRLGPFGCGEIGEHEVALGGPDLHPSRAQPVGELRPVFLVVRTA